jgi:rRNA maturation endonuclease Nob1
MKTRKCSACGRVIPLDDNEMCTYCRLNADIQKLRDEKKKNGR